MYGRFKSVIKTMGVFAAVDRGAEACLNDEKLRTSIHGTENSGEHPSIVNILRKEDIRDNTDAVTESHGPASDGRSAGETESAAHTYVVLLVSLAHRTRLLALLHSTPIQSFRVIMLLEIPFTLSQVCVSRIEYCDFFGGSIFQLHDRNPNAGGLECG
ncbi:hypothetical protein BD410DRAFT_806358 [Rickenella mellea]|uniref:Uncharacterized protein n=1 Tax=Rickenella mellea TaxID=50990 RepID=A0A4Y7PTB1_9AGAM|nr:hypothetical protein BD410DRAFT_806358 [Rickenella mellea]